MILTCYKRNFGFGTGFGNFYFKDKNGKLYYWGTMSDRAYEEINVGTKIAVTSYKTGITWRGEDGLNHSLKNVRFKVVEG